MKIRVKIERVVVDRAAVGLAPHPIVLRDAIRQHLAHLTGGPEPARSLPMAGEIATAIHKQAVKKP